MTAALLQEPLVLKSGAALKATGSALVLWGEVALLLGGPALSGWWRWQWGLSSRGLLIEAGVAIFLGVLYALRAWLHRKQFGNRLRRWGSGLRFKAEAKWSATVRSVEQKSRTLALALPHLIFVAVACTVLKVFPSTAHLLSQDAERITVLVRALLTLVAIHEAEACLLVQEFLAAQQRAQEEEEASAATPSSFSSSSAASIASSAASSLRRRFGTPSSATSSLVCQPVILCSILLKLCATPIFWNDFHSKTFDLQRT